MMGAVSTKRSISYTRDGAMPAAGRDLVVYPNTLLHWSIQTLELELWQRD